MRTGGCEHSRGRALRRAGAFHGDQAGLVTLEHALIMAAFVIPMYLVLATLLDTLGTYFSMLMFFNSLPFF